MAYTYIFTIAFTVALYYAIQYIIPVNEYGRLIEVEGYSKDSKEVQLLNASIKTNRELSQLYGTVAAFALYLM